jgi:hypothetical protein
LFPLDGIMANAMAGLGRLGPRSASERPRRRRHALEQVVLDLVLRIEAGNQSLDARLVRRRILARKHGNLGCQAMLEPVESRPGLPLRSLGPQLFWAFLRLASIRLGDVVEATEISGDIGESPLAIA